ncbi:MAG: hypothetical protein Q9209_003549 [Squamulea sp. 1 TL-2023]
MGAIHKQDLTSDVTHLIVGDVDTPKYKFVAKERPDVKCLTPTWIEALRELWLEGGEPDVQALELQHILPALHKLRVCVTGFEDMAYRKKLEDLVNGHGGEYRANLTKDVTHLIAKEASGAKYKYAVEWNINIVAVEWLEQSLERGLILDEKLYSLSTPPAERGRDAWIRRTVSTSSLGKRTFEGDAGLNGPRKLRRVASTRLSSQNVGLWTDIVSGDIKVEGPKHDQWSEQPAPRSVSMPTTSSTPVKSEGTSMEDLNGHAKSSATTVKTPIPPTADPLRKMGLFAGKRLYLHGFNEKKTSVLHKHLLSHDAEILPDCLSFTPSTIFAPNNEFLLVPHGMPKDQIPDLPDIIHPPVVVTDMWIERILHRKQYIRPEANVTNTPFQRFPVLGFEGLVVCSTGFEGVDLLHMSKAVKLMGATYDEDFTTKASVLVCNQVIAGHEKLRHAYYWNIPTVTADWLWDCIKSGELQSFEPYLVQPYSARSTLGAQEQAAGGAENVIKHDAVVKKSDSLDQDTKDPVKTLPHPTTTKAKPQENEATSHNETTVHRKDSSKSPTTSSPHKPFLLKPTSPLKEISPNSSPPKPSTSPSKPIPIIKPLSSSNPSLSSAITSLLAHHQTARRIPSSASSNPVPPQNPPPRPPIRRKRQLFGRAPSNASNLSLSRASSVDTVNTDGVGTPVEMTTMNQGTTTNSSSNHAPFTISKHASTRDNDDDIPFNPLSHYTSDEERQQRESNEEQLQMTQLGYEDPDALAWREKVARKLCVGGGKGEGEGRKRVREIGVVKDVLAKAPVGRRTRGQGAGR